ncbi:MAG TPA: N-acetyltransferase, partial [Candidatus Aphodomonas merdavium]|nr:N-acetyltransferase [Candidatus Aphodomonas merdavium]
LLECSFERAAAMGYDTIVIFGDPANYVNRGFQSCKKHNVCLENGKFPASMLVKELVPGALCGKRWTYHDSPVMAVSSEAAQAYDDTLEKMEKKVLPCQETFYIMSHAYIE